jgi:hypothetical protein
MPRRSGPHAGEMKSVYTFRDIADSSPIGQIASTRCSRAGRYRLAKLIVRHGGDFSAAIYSGWFSRLPALADRRGRPTNSAIRISQGSLR